MSPVNTHVSALCEADAAGHVLRPEELRCLTTTQFKNLSLYPLTETAAIQPTYYSRLISNVEVTLEKRIFKDPFKPTAGGCLRN